MDERRVVSQANPDPHAQDVEGEPRCAYVDFEFLRDLWAPAGLVSIGLTDDEGRDYYAVNADCAIRAVYREQWMRENVWQFLPHAPARPGLRHRLAARRLWPASPLLLDRRDPAVKPLAEIRREVTAWFELAGQRRNHLYVHYGSQDVCRLHSLYGHDWHGMPRAVPTWAFELRALREQAGQPDMPRQASDQHHALADAQHARVQHEFLLGLAAEQGSPVRGRVLFSSESTSADGGVRN